MFPNWVLASLALINRFPCPIGMKPLKKQRQPGLALELTGFFFRALLSWDWECEREKAEGTPMGRVRGTGGSLPVQPPSGPHPLTVPKLEDNKVFVSSKCLFFLLGFGRCLARGW